MPQLWLTYDEVALELGCTPEQARAASHASEWPHKHSHDGHSRTMLPPDLMMAYFSRAASEYPQAVEQARKVEEHFRRHLGEHIV